MHILDLVMYIVSVIVIWWLMDKLSGGNLTEEIGGLMGMLIMIIYSIAYLVVFCIWPDLNWIDIFNGMYSAHFSNWFKL